MLRHKTLFLASIFASVVALCPFACAQNDADDIDSHARIVRISYVSGEVRLDNGHGYENATMNIPLTEGNWLETRSDGWVEVQLEDGSAIRLAPDTQISFSQLGYLSSGGSVTTVDLDQGEAEFKIAKHDDSEFQVTVRNKAIVLNRSGQFRITSTNSEPLKMAVWNGEVGVRDPDSGDQVAVLKNETFQLNAEDVSQYALDKGAEADNLDQWSRRDEYLSTYASGSSTSADPDGTGDLNSYGQYYDVPGYGNVWQPYNVSMSWDPFTNGYWTDLPGYGWTWISSYPWGWKPYRYGSWIFVNGRGWCWRPGHREGWHTRPRLVNAPPGFHPPAPPLRTIAAPRRIIPAPGRIVRDHGYNNPVRGAVPSNKDGGPVTAPPSQISPPDRNDRDRGHNAFAGGAGIVRRDGGPEVAPQNPGQGAGRTYRRVYNEDNMPSRVPPPSAAPGSGTAQPSGAVHVEYQPKPVEHAAPASSLPPARQYTPPPAQHVAPPQPQQSPPARQSAPAPRPAPPAASPKSEAGGKIKSSF